MKSLLINLTMKLVKNTIEVSPVINISVITETKKKLEGTKDLNYCLMLYSGIDSATRAQSGLAVMTDKR